MKFEVNRKNGVLLEDLKKLVFMADHQGMSDKAEVTGEPKLLTTKGILRKLSVESGDDDEG